jgi:HlyD family secretion protein
MTRKRILAAVVLAGLAGLGGMALMAGSRPPSADLPAALSNPLISAAGKVEPRSEEVRLGASITGKLEEVLVDEGDPVAAGQLVARLENADWRARLAEAEATVHIREAELTRLLNGSRPEERREAEAVVHEAEAVLDQAERDLERVTTLGRGGWEPPQNLEKMRRDRLVAEAKLGAARQHLAVVAAAARDDERARAEAAVELARAQRDEAAAMLAKTRIVSPISGVVLRKHRRVGEMISEAQDMPILSVGDTQVLRVRAEVDEADIGRVAIGQAAWVRADAFGDTRFSGKVVRVGAMLGRKRIHTDQPAEKLDDKVLEVLIELDGHPPLPVGLRVDAFVTPAPTSDRQAARQ